MKDIIVSVDKLSKNYYRYTQETSLKGIIKGLFKRNYISVAAVNNVSFNIYAGEIVGLLGPNGSGKSTIMKILSGIIKPSCGKVNICNFIPHLREPSFLSHIALVMGQKSRLWWDLPAMDTFLLMKQLYQIPQQLFRQTLTFLVEEFSVSQLLNIQVRKLSLGERIKMELISMLLHTPRVLFLDEPTIGLDFYAQHSIRKTLREFNKQYNTTILLTSHYLEDISELCEKVVVLNKGKVVFNNYLTNLTHKYTQLLTITVKIGINNSPPSLEVWQKCGVVTDVTHDTYRLKIPKANLIHCLKILQSYQITHFVIEESSIEEALSDLFQNSTKERGDE